MKVLILIHGLGVGGAESMVCHLARHLHGAGARVEVDCLGDLGMLGEGLRGAGLSVSVHERRPGFDGLLVARLARRLRGGRFDVVHLHQRTALVYGVLAGLFDRTPLVYTEHGPYVVAATRRRLRAFNRLLGWRLRRVTAVSDALAHELAEREGLSPSRIEVVLNGVDVESFDSHGGEARTQARIDMGVPPDAEVLGSVGRLDSVKNHGLLVHVARRLRERRPNLHLVLVGDGSEGGFLQALARDLGIGDRVRLLGARRDVPALLPGFDVFCLSSLDEGTPVALLEAMASRVPVVSTAVGGAPYTIGQNGDGILVPGTPPDCRQAPSESAARYVEGYASAVEGLLADPILGRQLAERGRERAASLFSVQAVCRQYERILRDEGRG